MKLRPREERCNLMIQLLEKMRR